MKNIDKKELIKKLNNYNIISIQEEYEDNIGFYKIIYGEHMAKISKMDLILNRLDKIDSRLDKIENRLDKVESKLDNLEKKVSQLEIDVNQIKQCPTIKQELSNL